MSEPGPLGSGDFGGLPPFMRDLAALFSSQGPVNWQLARQMAVWVAAQGQPESNVDPLERIAVEEIARVAELHVSDATGLLVTTGGPLRVRTVGPAEWANTTLDAWRPVFEALAGALGGPQPDPAEEADPSDPFAGLLGNLQQVIGPFLIGLQVGTLVGHLGRRALGQYELPIPRPQVDEIVVVPNAIAAFARDWSLNVDDVRMWVCLSELTHHAVLARPHVRDRLSALLRDHAGAFRVDASAIEDKLSQLDPSNPQGLEELFDAQAILGAVQSPEQQRIAAELAALVAAIEGYVDHVLDTVGKRLVGNYGAITEALRRRRIEDADSDRFVQGLLGLNLDRAQFDRGERFVLGIHERAGDDGLARLWRSERELPTPAEVDAPGLWLARIDLPD